MVRPTKSKRLKPNSGCLQCVLKSMHAVGKVMWTVITDICACRWGSQILTSWRGDVLECLDAYGTFKFQVTFRVEVHQLGHVTHFKEGGSLNETLNRVVFTACLLFGCVSVGVCLEWKGWGELVERKS